MHCTMYGMVWYGMMVCVAQSIVWYGMRCTSVGFFSWPGYLPLRPSVRVQNNKSNNLEAKRAIKAHPASHGGLGGKAYAA